MMAVITVRLVLVWVLLMAVIRLMGKRQIGEMEMSELITALMLSELAALPVADSGIPLLFSVVPILLLAALEILTSSAVLHSRFLQRMISGCPTVLICHGVIDQRALKQCRITLSELMGELRQKGITDPADADYAILEENGRMSVIPKKETQPPSAKDLAKQVKETGICHTLIADGEISRVGLAMSGRTEQELRQLLARCGIRDLRAVYLMTADDAGNIRAVRKEDETFFVHAKADDMVYKEGKKKERSKR